MGRPRKMTARALKKRINVYFDSIRAEKPMLVKVPVMMEDENGRKYPVLDAFGHEKMMFEQVVTADGLLDNPLCFTGTETGTFRINQI